MPLDKVGFLLIFAICQRFDGAPDLYCRRSSAGEEGANFGDSTQWIFGWLGL